MSLHRWAFGALALMTACSSGDVSGSVQLLVINADTSTDPPQYSVTPKQVTTLHNIKTLSGDAATILVHGKVNVDPEALDGADPATNVDLAKLITPTIGSPPSFDSFEVSGYTYPVDAYGLNLATTYYNFEQAQQFFLNAGAMLSPVTVQYEPDISGDFDGPISPETDTIVSDPYLNTFIVTDRGSGSDVPTGLQLGVVGHQYAHAVFRTQVYADEGLPWLESKRAKDAKTYAPVSNLVRSLDEGLADYFGASIAAFPAFVRLSGGDKDPDRELGTKTPHCALPAIIQAQKAQSRDQYNPYPLGTVLAGVLWEVSASRVDLQDQFNAGLVTALQTVGKRLKQHDANQTLADALDALVTGIPSDLQPKTCGLLFDRFHMTKADIPTCTMTRTPDTRCAF